MGGIQRMLEEHADDVRAVDVEAGGLQLAHTMLEAIDEPFRKAKRKLLGGFGVGHEKSPCSCLDSGARPSRHPSSPTVTRAEKMPRVWRKSLDKRACQRRFSATDCRTVTVPRRLLGA